MFDLYSKGLGNLLDLFDVNAFFFILVIVALFLLYLLPTIFAMTRRKIQFLAIFLLNVFAGWTGIGWLAALIWAAIKEKSDGT